MRRPSAVLAALHDLQFEDFYVGGAPTSTPAREVLVRRANGTTYTLVCAADRDLDELLMPGDVVAVDAVHEGR